MATQFSGGTPVNATFPGTYKCLIMQGIITNLLTAGWNFLPMSTGGSPGSYGLATMGNGGVSTVTLTVATGVVNWTSHGFLGGERVMFQHAVNAGATLPTGIAVNNWYYVKYVNANSFNVAATYGGANIAFTGSTTGTVYCYSAYVLMYSATQSSVTNPATIRICDNGGTCLNITIQNYACTMFANNGIIQGSGNGRYYGAQLQPFLFINYQIIATRYQFFVFTPGTNASNRSYAHAGMLFVPSFLATVTDHSFVFADTCDGETTNYCSCFRNVVTMGYNNTPNFQFIWNDNVCEGDNIISAANNSYAGWPNTLIMVCAYWQSSQGQYRWANDTYNTSDVLLTCGLNTYGMEGKIKGQFYDLIYIPEAFALDTTDTFNGHTWQNLTNNNQSIPRGGMWVPIT
jgi:hypothetical protein